MSLHRKWTILHSGVFFGCNSDIQLHSGCVLGLLIVQDEEKPWVRYASCYLLNLTVSKLLILFSFLLISRVWASMSNFFCWKYNFIFFWISFDWQGYISSNLILFLVCLCQLSEIVLTRCRWQPLSFSIQRIEEKNHLSSGCANLNGTVSKISLWPHRATVTNQFSIMHQFANPCQWN